VTAARSVPADPHGAKQRHRVRAVAKQRAASWLARAHPQQYRACYAQALDRIRAQAPGLPAWRARERAGRQARADLQARFPDEYAVRVQAELATLQPDEPAVEVGRVERPAAARARLRALLWLADRHPDQTRARFAAEAARLPLRAADRAQGRRRALAWVRAPRSSRPATPRNSPATPARGHRHDRLGRAPAWAGPPAASAGVGGPARPPGEREGVVARLT
jgi:hypothetical protein